MRGNADQNNSEYGHLLRNAPWNLNELGEMPGTTNDLGKFINKISYWLIVFGK